MSRFEYLQKCAKWAKARMWKQRAQPETFTATSGGTKTLKGWRVIHLRSWREESHYSQVAGDYEEWWGRDEIILSTNGTLYVYTTSSHETGAGMTGSNEPRLENETRLHILDPTNFGRKGNIVTIQDVISLLQQMGK